MSKPKFIFTVYADKARRCVVGEQRPETIEAALRGIHDDFASEIRSDPQVRQFAEGRLEMVTGMGRYIAPAEHSWSVCVGPVQEVL